MKGLIIRGVSVSSILFFFISCQSVKIDKDIEKIAILNDDYIIKRYKGETSSFTIDVLEVDDTELINDFYIRLNGVRLFIENTDRTTYYVVSNQKYDIDIGSLGYKRIKIRNIKVSEKDSIVINAYLKEYPVLY